MPTNKEKLIQDRIKRSNEFYRARKKKQEQERQERKAKKQKIHQYNKLVDNLIETKDAVFWDTDLIDGEIPCSILIVPKQKLSNYYKCTITYALTSKKDTFDYRIGRSICGERQESSTTRHKVERIIHKNIFNNTNLLQYTIECFLIADCILEQKISPRTIKKEHIWSL